MGVEIKYNGVAIGAKQAFVPAANTENSSAPVSRLKQDEPVTNSCATLELNQWLLNGTGEMLGSPEGGYGWWSSELCGTDCLFSTPPQLTLNAPALFSSVGFSLAFDAFTGCYPTQVSIAWYRNDELLSEKSFTPNSPTYFFSNTVRSFNKVIMTFNSLSLPRRYLKLTWLEFGVVRTFKSGELQSVSVIDELNPVSTEISVNTLDFTLVNKTNTEYVFESKQALEVWFNGINRGKYFINKAKRLGADRYDIAAEDYIGLLGKVNFNGGLYTSKPAATLLQEISSLTNVPIDLSTAFAGVTLSGHIPVCSCRDALMQIVFSLGAVTRSTDKIYVYALLPAVASAIPLSRTIQGQSFEESDKITEVQLGEHLYTAAQTVISAYSAADSGIGDNIYVVFNEPLHSLAITNGTVLDSGANYAYINATTTACVLSGKQYNHSTKMLAKKNPVVDLSELQNIVCIDNATLISQSNSARILDLCYDYFMLRKTTKSRLVVENEKCGDMVTLSTEYMGEVTGRIESMRYNLNGNAVVAETEVR